jgi:hypothetical protein
LDDPGGFLGGQGAPDAAAVGLLVLLDQRLKGIVGGPPVPLEPSGERFGGGQVGIHGAGRQSIDLDGGHGQHDG